MAKLPALLFYVGDWRKDPGVQSLNFHDRGVWFEMLCLMHESEVRGRLVLNGKPMTEEQLSRLLGLDKQALAKTIHALYEAGVCAKCHSSGALICRRMVRDEEIRVKRSVAGRLGGNPDLVNHSKDVIKQVDKVIKQDDNVINLFSTSSPKEVNHLTKQTLNMKEVGEAGEIEVAQETASPFDFFWRAYPAKSGKKEARIAYDKALARLRKTMDLATAQEKLLNAALEYARFLHSHPDPPRVKYAQGWLNQERYEDEMVVFQPNGAARDPRGNLSLLDNLNDEGVRNGF